MFTLIENGRGCPKCAHKTISMKLKKVFYIYNEAARTCQKLKIKTAKEYYRKYKIDSKLPSNPDKVYKDAGWVSWQIFTGNIN